MEPLNGVYPGLFNLCSFKKPNDELGYHSFHTACLTEWFKHNSSFSCPQCRKDPTLGKKLEFKFTHQFFYEKHQPVEATIYNVGKTADMFVEEMKTKYENKIHQIRGEKESLVDEIARQKKIIDVKDNEIQILKINQKIAQDDLKIVVGVAVILGTTTVVLATKLYLSSHSQK